MKDELTLKDFYRFFIDNIKIILGSMIIFTIAVVGYVIYSNVSEDQIDVPDELPVESTTPTLSEERYEEMAEWPIEFFSEDQISEMQEYLLPRAYRLTIYAEHENYEPITNTTFMREVFRNNEVLDHIENQLGEDLTPAIDFAIHIENLADSGIYELHFQRGTQEESLELGYILMEAIEEEAIPVLDNKTVHFINEEPEIIIDDYSDQLNEINLSSGVSIINIIRDSIIYSIAALIIGAIIGIVLALITSGLDKRVSALFDYVRDESDKVVRLNQLRKSNSKDKIGKGIKNINLPLDHKKIVLYENESNKELEPVLFQLDSNISIYTDFSYVNNSMENIKEIIILSKVNKTTKDWYNNQRVQLKGYNIPIKIVQI